jgi:hypothetical protein
MDSLKFNLIIIGTVMIVGTGVWYRHKDVHKPETVSQVLSAESEELTPTGDIIKGITKEMICTKDYEIESVATGIPYKEGFEVDLLIPIELGGSYDKNNLWLQPINTFPGYTEKNLVETYLHKEVCNGNMTLEKAQEIIKTDWVREYQKLGS